MQARFMERADEHPSRNAKCVRESVTHCTRLRRNENDDALIA